VSPFFLSVPLLVIVVTVAAGNSFAQTTFGASTPTVVDGGNPTPAVLDLKIFSDVPGGVLGCSFYKAPANIGVHVVSLWDSAGKVLATQAATAETASGKQSVLFSSPVSIASKQTVICGYFAPQGHYSYDSAVFQTQKDVSPLHVPVNGGRYAYGTQSTTWPNEFNGKQFLGGRIVRAFHRLDDLDRRSERQPKRQRGQVYLEHRGAGGSQVKYGPDQPLRRHNSLGGTRSHSPHRHSEWLTGRNHISLPRAVPRLGRNAGPQYVSCGQDRQLYVVDIFPLPQVIG